MLQRVLGMRAGAGKSDVKTRQRVAARQRDRMFGLLEQSYAKAERPIVPMWSGQLGRMITFLQKPPHERSQSDIDAIARFLSVQCRKYQYLQTKSNATIRQIAAVLGVREVPPNSPVYRQGDIGDVLYILASGAVTVVLEETVETLAEAKEAKEEIATARAKPLKDRQRVFLDAISNRHRPSRHNGSRSTVTENGALAADGARARWKSVGKAVAASSRFTRMMSTLKAAIQNNRVVASIVPGGHFGELSLQTVKASPRCTSAFTTKHSLFFTLDKHTHIRLRTLDPDPQDFADYFRFFRGLDVFSTLTTPQLVRLTYSATEWTAARGTVVAHEGVHTPNLIFVRRGSCKVERKSANSALPFELGIIGQGQFFGEKSVLFHLPSAFTVTCETSTSFLSISAVDLWPFKRFTQALFIKHARNKHRWHNVHFQQVAETAHRYQPKPRPVVKPAHASRSLTLTHSSRQMLSPSGASTPTKARGEQRRDAPKTGSGARAWFGQRRDAAAAESSPATPQTPQTGILKSGLFRRLPSSHSFVGVKPIGGVIVHGPRSFTPDVVQAVHAALSPDTHSLTPVHLTPGHSRRKSSMQLAADNLRPMLSSHNLSRMLTPTPSQLDVMAKVKGRRSPVVPGAIANPYDAPLPKYHGHTRLPHQAQLKSPGSSLALSFARPSKAQRSVLFAPVSDPVQDVQDTMSLRLQRTAAATRAVQEVTSRRATTAASAFPASPVHKKERKRRLSQVQPTNVPAWEGATGPNGDALRPALRSDVSAYPLPRGYHTPMHAAGKDRPELFPEQGLLAGGNTRSSVSSGSKVLEDQDVDARVEYSGSDSDEEQRLFESGATSPVEYGPSRPMNSVHRLTLENKTNSCLNFEQQLAQRMELQAAMRKRAQQLAAARYMGPTDPVMQLHSTLRLAHAAERGRVAKTHRRSSASRRRTSPRRHSAAKSSRRGSANKSPQSQSQSQSLSQLQPPLQSQWMSPSQAATSMLTPAPTPQRRAVRPSTAPTRSPTAREGKTVPEILRKSETSVLAAEEHQARQKALNRVETILNGTKTLLRERPPAYEWEREVGPKRRSVLNFDGDAGNPKLARLAKIGAQPLRRRGLAGVFKTKARHNSGGW